MSFEDLFEDDKPNNEVTVSDETTSMGNVTLKANWEAPWVTGVTVEDLADPAKQNVLIEAMKAAAVASAAFSKMWDEKRPAIPTTATPAAQKPGGTTETNRQGSGLMCSHGERVKVSGTSGKGFPWSGAMCPQPKEAADKCDPVWLDKNGNPKQ